MGQENIKKPDGDDQFLYDYKDYYHGFLAGLLKMMDGYTLRSNRESGLEQERPLLTVGAPTEGMR